jgi:hypothetical protein
MWRSQLVFTGSYQELAFGQSADQLYMYCKILGTLVAYVGFYSEEDQ